MNQPKFILAIACMFGALLISSTAAMAQNASRVEPSYQVSLQVVVGSNDASPRELPANLSAISRDLKSSFPFSNYRLASTFLARISDSGTFEYKSVSNVLGQETTGASPTFLNWSLADFRSMPNDKGQAGFQARGFNFGARVPVVSESFKDPSGKGNSVVNYEAIGLSMNKVGFLENAPTLMGTLSLPGATGTLFLVVTIKSAAQ